MRSEPDINSKGTFIDLKLHIKQDAVKAPRRSVVDILKNLLRVE